MGLKETVRQSVMESGLHWRLTNEPRALGKERWIAASELLEQSHEARANEQPDVEASLQAEAQVQATLALAAAQLAASRKGA